MPYNPNIPAPSNTPANDQPLMLQNFQQLATSWQVNHTPLASGGGTEGFHTQINVPVALAGDPNLSAPVGSIYMKTVSAVNQLFFQNGNLPANVVQLTGSTLTSGVSSDGGSWQIFLTPWGFRIYTGTAASNSGSRNVTLLAAPPFGGTIFTAQATVFGGNPTGVSFTPNATMNTYNVNTGNNIPVHWFVICT